MGCRSLSKVTKFLLTRIVVEKLLPFVSLANEDSALHFCFCLGWLDEFPSNRKAKYCSRNGRRHGVVKHRPVWGNGRNADAG